MTLHALLALYTYIVRCAAKDDIIDEDLDRLNELQKEIDRRLKLLDTIKNEMTLAQLRVYFPNDYKILFKF